MLRRALLLAIIVLFAIPTQVAAQTWVEYRPPGVGFALDMPSGWSTQVKEVDNGTGSYKASIASVDAGGAYYLAMYITFPPDRLRGVPLKSILDGARDGAVANVHGHLRSEEPVTVGNFAGRQIVIDGADNLVGVQKFIMMGTTLVTAIVAGPAGVENEPNTKRFMQSMRIVPP